MVEYLKKKGELEVEVRCGGKVLVMEFSKLREEDFPYVDFTNVNLQEQWALPAFDGKLYVNKNVMDAEQFLIPILEILMNNSYKNLKKFERMNRKKYRNLSFDNLTEFIKGKDNKSIVKAIYYLLIPAEQTRRFIERNYYRSEK